MYNEIIILECECMCIFSLNEDHIGQRQYNHSDTTM